MANKTLNTRIVLRHDTAANWTLHNPVLLLGEAGYETDTQKLKFGDGTKKWSELPYFGEAAESVAQVYQTEINHGTDHVEAINSIVDGVQLHNGDIAIVKELISNDKRSYTSYVYNGSEWVAMDGNVSADNVYFTKDLTFTQAFGKFTPDSSGSIEIPTATNSLNLQALLEQAFAEEKDPKIDQPWVSIRLNEAGAKEVGTSIVPSYSVTFNPGNYQYGPATGITATYAVSDTAKNTATAKEGKFTVEGGNYQFTVADDTNYKVSVVATHTAGAAPKNNLGNEKSDLAIKAGTKSSTSSAITGYRNSFWGGVKSKEGTPTSDVIRALAGKKGGSISAGSTGDAAESVGDMRVIIAVPAPRTITSIKDVNGLNAEAFSAFKHTTVDVEGANGYTAKSYNVYYKDNAAACDKANKWHFTVA